MRLIVLLEHPDTVDPAEGAEEDTEASEHAKPGLETAIGELARVEASWGRTFWFCEASSFLDVTRGRLRDNGEDGGLGVHRGLLHILKGRRC